MPIYEYACSACGHDWELIQRVDSPAPGSCPDCSSDEVGKRVSLSSFQLKGTGWYVTDFRDGGKKDTGAKTPNKPSSAGDSSSESTGATESSGSSEGKAGSDTKAPADKGKAAEKGKSSNSSASAA